MKLTIAASLSALVLSTSPAWAGAISYTAPAYTLGDNSTPNTLPGFDPALGALTGATVSFTGTIRGRASSDFARERPAAVDVAPYLVISLLAAAGAYLPALTITPTYFEDGGYSASFSAPVDLGPYGFEIPDGVGGEPIAYTIAGGFDMSPNPAEKFDNSAPFDGTATVTYEYVLVPRDIPEPASFILLGIGLAGLAAPRYRATTASTARWAPRRGGSTAPRSSRPPPAPHSARLSRNAHRV